MAVALDERLIASTVGALELFSIHLGRNLGLYEALDEPRTVAELAETSGIDSRYSREWLEQQAVAGFVTVDDPELTWNRRRYWLDADQHALFARPEHLSHVSPLADMVVGIGQVLPDVANAFSSGGGVPYPNYGASFRDGQAGINRPAFTHELATTWLGAVPDVAERLNQGGRVADLGCGAGWSTIALARAFPNCEVVGIDNDRASIADARANAAAAGVAVRFEWTDASELNGPYDLVLILEALHDLAAPVGVLRQVRRTLAGHGAVLVADEKVNDRFVAPGDELERMMYGWSVVHCLPATLAEEGSAGIGTVLRPDLVATLAGDAGFTSTELSDIDAGFFNLYTLRP
ncbi:MAG: methyltransferase domain-containing protein [Acidimicrobiia bacterium]|nr:methyltransferase domain-containing protein [Acidimicrobiia bacterium]